MTQLARISLGSLVALLGSLIGAYATATEPPDSATAAPSPFEAGALLGGGFFQINTPDDPVGTPTFLYGSAFSGGGLVLGATGTYGADRFFGMELDLLYSWSSILGLAETSSSRREVRFSEHGLRLAWLAKFNLALPNPVIELGFGPELIWTIGASVAETVTGVVVTEEPPLEVTTTLTVMPIGQLGVAIDLGSFKIPLALRLGWNPFFPHTTQERFEGFNGPEDPGAFIVGVDWYLLGLAGIRFDL